MSSDHQSVLRRIAQMNAAPTVGPGFDPEQMVPAFTIHRRTIAEQLEKELRAAPMPVECRHARLRSEFFVPGKDLQRALAIQSAFLAEHPDSPLRNFTRDYDTVILLLPVTVLVSIVLCFTPLYTPLVLLALWVSSGSAMWAGERIHREYSVQRGRQRLLELFITTAIIAANFALWRWAIMGLHSGI